MNRLAMICLVLLLPVGSNAQSLEARLQALAPGQWLSYEVPMQPGLRSPCCIDWKSRRDAKPAACRLEDRDWNFGTSDDDPLAPAGSTLRVMLRRAAQGHDRLHAIGAACTVDSGQALVVEAGVLDAADSLAFLGRAMHGGEKQRRQDALVAVAYHAGEGADRLLTAAARGDDKRLRRDAPFWLTHTRGEYGYRIVRDLIESSAHDELNPLVFALSISPVDEAAAELRRLAREHRNDGVRGEAMFWLAQDHDPQAEAILKAAVTGDASPEVRKKAVFALSQLPAERAVPALRQLVEHGGSRAVRKEALFWLAQVDSDAVLPVFDELLGQ